VAQPNNQRERLALTRGSRPSSPAEAGEDSGEVGLAAGDLSGPTNHTIAFLTSSRTPAYLLPQLYCTDASSTPTRADGGDGARQRRRNRPSYSDLTAPTHSTSRDESNKPDIEACERPPWHGHERTLTAAMEAPSGLRRCTLTRQNRSTRSCGQLDAYPRCTEREAKQITSKRAEQNRA
jgi:hypothetical protein